MPPAYRSATRSCPQSPPGLMRTSPERPWRRLLVVDRTRQDEEQELPRLKDEVQGLPRGYQGNPEYGGTAYRLSIGRKRVCSGDAQVAASCKVIARLNTLTLRA